MTVRINYRSDPHYYNVVLMMIQLLRAGKHSLANSSSETSNYRVTVAIDCCKFRRYIDYVNVISNILIYSLFYRFKDETSLMKVTMNLLLDIFLDDTYNTWIQL